MRASRLLRAVPAAVRPASIALVIAAMVACADYMTAPSDSTKVVRQPRAIKLSSASVAMLVGNQSTIVATILDQMGQPMDPAPSTAHVTWKSSDSTRARVDASGVVTALHSGSVTVSAALASDLGPIAVSTSVGIRGRVTKLVLLGGGAQSGTVGNALAAPVAVRLLDNAGDPMPGMWIRFAGGTSNGSPAPDSAVTDSTGAAAATWTLGQHAGVDTLSVNAGDSTGAASVLVTATAQAGPAAQAHLTPASLSFGTLGRTAKVSVTYKDRFGNPTAAPTTAPAFGSSAPTVATVDQRGSVKAVGNGSAAITMSGMTSDTVSVTVRQVVAALALKAPSPVQAGSATQLTLAASDSGGAPVIDAQIAWTLTPAGAGTVDASGIFHPVKAGTDTIHAASSGITATAVVQVTAGAPAHIVAVSGDNQTAAAGATLGAPIEVRVTDANANLVQGATVTFSDASGGTAAPPATSTDVNGQASTQWTLSANRAAVPALVAKIATDSVTFHATISGGGGHVPLGLTRVWTDSTDDGMWTTAANWKPVGVPVAADTVQLVSFLSLPYHGHHSPQLSTNTQIAALTTGGGQVVHLNVNDTLVVSGDVNADVENGGILKMTGTNAHVAGPNLAFLLVTGSVTLGGNLQGGAFTLAGGSLTLGGHSLSVQQLSADSTGALVMTNASDSLFVYGSGGLTFYRTPERGKLTAGKIVVRDGNLSTFYLPSDSGRTDFYAPPSVHFFFTGFDFGPQSVTTPFCDCATTPPTLGTMHVKGSGTDVFRIQGRVKASGNLFLNGVVLSVDRGVMEVADSTIVYSASLQGSTFIAHGPLKTSFYGYGQQVNAVDLLRLHDATGSTLASGVLANELDMEGANQLLGGGITASTLRIDGSVTLNGYTAVGSDAQVYGSLDLDGQQLQVGRTLNVYGKVLMTRPSDQILVHGDLGFYAQAGTQLSDGQLIVSSDVTSKVFFGQSPSVAANYVASGHNTFRIRHTAGKPYVGPDSIYIAANDRTSTFQGFTVDSGEVAYVDNPNVPAHGSFTIAPNASLTLSATTRFTADTLMVQAGARLVNNSGGYIGWCAAYSAAPTATITGTAPVSACGNGGGGGQLAGVTRTWTGATSTDWSTASNWSPAAVPGAADTVVIGSTVNRPLLATNGTIGMLNISSTGALTVSANDTLTVTGDAVAQLAGPGVLHMTGSAAHLKGAITTAPLLITGHVTANGNLNTYDVVLKGGLFDVGGQYVNVNNFTADSTSGFFMNGPQDNLGIKGNMYLYRTPERGRLLGGSLYVEGSRLEGMYLPADSVNGTDFYADSNMTLFVYAAATIGTPPCNCAHTPMTFGRVTFQQPATLEGTVNFSGSWAQPNYPVTVERTTVYGNVRVPTNGVSGGTFILKGDLTPDAGAAITLDTLELDGPHGDAWIVTPGTMNVGLVRYGGTNEPINGYALGWGPSRMQVTGSGYLTARVTAAQTMILPTGSLDLAGHYLNVQGAFMQNGALLMTHAADTLLVHGDVRFAGTNASQLTAGAFIMSSDSLSKAYFGLAPSIAANYAASGSHTFHVRHTAGHAFVAADSIYVVANDNVSHFQTFAVDSGEVVYIDNPTAVVNGTMTLGTSSNVVLGPNNRFSADALVLQDNAILMNGLGGKIGYCTSYVVAPTASVTGTPPVHSCGVVPARAPVP